MFPRNLRLGRHHVAVLLAVVVLVGLIVAATVESPPALAAITNYGVVEAWHFGWNGGHSAYDIPVEPVTGEHWVITVTLTAVSPPYTPITESKSVDVDWNGTAFATSNGTFGNYIVAYNSSCTTGECGSLLSPHGYGYKLQVGVFVPTGYALYKVDFIVNNVDSGYTLTGTPCAYTNSVSCPTPYVWGATDTSFFEPTFSCNNTGPTVVIPYE
jgi:hypothetical protein